jgi:hypothetical protein
MNERGDGSPADALGGGSSRDHRRVRELLGREPAGRYEVVVRDHAGEPLVIRNAPLLDDGTPMPTRYWLVGADAVAAVSRLEATGGVRAAEAAVEPAELAAAHARYAAERDAAVPAGAALRPAGGVAGTRQGVKCLHAHYAWYLAGGDDPVGRWVAAELAGPLAIEITVDQVVVEHRDWSAVLPVNPRTLVAGELGEHDPPTPLSLANALGIVTDVVDDVLRERPEILDAPRITFAGDEAWHLANVERGTADLDDPVTIPRDDLEDLFRTLAIEPRSDRRHNPALLPERVDLVVATCCLVVAIVRRFQFAQAQFTSAVLLAQAALGSTIGGGAATAGTGR